MKKVLLFLLFFIFTCFLTNEVFASGTVDINTASLAQLDEITGIGPVIAQRIIDARPFSSVDDLLRVKGIGPATLQKIKDQGLAFVSGQTQQPAQPVDQTPTPTQIPAVAPNTATNSPTADATPITYPTGVVINEIMPNPAGADEENEWIELYNTNNTDVDLSGWQLQDTAGTITTYAIPQATKILANAFLIFKRPGTKIMLNNDHDGLNLLTPDKKITDSTTFASAPLNQSYNKTNSGWQWSLTLTAGAKNVITSADNGDKTLSNAKNSVKNDSVANGLADISQDINTNQDSSTKNPWFLFFIVSATAVTLGGVVLFIKFKLKKNLSG